MPESRKLNLRLPADLAQEATAQAAALGISLNAFLILGVRNWVTYKRREIGAIPARSDAAATPTPPKAVSGEKGWPKVGRNDPCPCGSGRKWKVCHGQP